MIEHLEAQSKKKRMLVSLAAPSDSSEPAREKSALVGPKGVLPRYVSIIYGIIRIHNNINILCYNAIFLLILPNLWTDWA